MEGLFFTKEEIQKLLSYAGEIPHKYGKEIEGFILQTARNREQEEKAKANKPSSEGQEEVVGENVTTGN